VTYREITTTVDVSVTEDVSVEMRDGTALFADVSRPAEDDSSLATLLARTPYDKRDAAETATALAERGFTVVFQDVRGRFASEGDFYPYRSEGAADGYDTVEWAAARPWSNGRVGTFGISYLAGTRWALAHGDALPPHLEAMAPGFAVSSYYRQSAYAGGVPLLSHNVDYTTEFAVERFDRDHPERADEVTHLGRARQAIPQLYWDLPVDPYEPLERAGYPWLADWHGHETYDEFWREQDHTRQYDTVDVPVLILPAVTVSRYSPSRDGEILYRLTAGSINHGGRYDIFAQGTVENFRGLCREAGTETARNGARLVMGPHAHGDTGLRAQGQTVGHAFEFAENSTYDRPALLAAFFDRHLRERQDGADSDSSPDAETDAEPVRARLYVSGFDEWVGSPTVPLPETDRRTYYLHSDGDARVDGVDSTAPGYGGRLTTEIPEAEPPDEYTYDPSDPVRSVGGYNTHWDGGVADRATACGGREDVLVYETDPLSEPVTVLGPVTVTLYASTSAVDTDFVVVLSDVDPTERVGGTWVAEGARRGRIGDVEADPRADETDAEVGLLEPEVVSAWRIAVWPTARQFAADHRIRVDLASSNFPRYARNLNTGASPGGTETVVTKQTV
jgi:predicted acyl esterase